jgi:hypothetical protein
MVDNYLVVKHLCWVHRDAQQKPSDKERILIYSPKEDVYRIIQGELTAWDYYEDAEWWAIIDGPIGDNENG